MQITCHARKTMRCPARKVFDLSVDHLRFPSSFTGYGPIPAVRSIRLEGPLAVGTVRYVHNSDGTTLSETITALDSPIRHAYALRGFRAPFSWLVSHGDADWTLSPSTDLSVTEVTWVYRFVPTSVLTWPLARVVGLLMARAMTRCLIDIAGRLEARDAVPQRA